MKDDPDDKWNPRWKSRKDFWNSIPLECVGKPEGVGIYEEFAIKAKVRKP